LTEIVFWYPQCVKAGKKGDWIYHSVTLLYLLLGWIHKY